MRFGGKYQTNEDLEGIYPKDPTTYTLSINKGNMMLFLANLS